MVFMALILWHEAGLTLYIVLLQCFYSVSTVLF